MSLCGQTILQGIVQDKYGDALPQLNVLIYTPDAEVLIAYAISDQQGFFEATVNTGSDSLLVKVNSLNYRSDHRMIANTTQKLIFKLYPESKEITGITVKASPINQRGDTLSYLVSSFAKKDDRSIEDVLRRMPGIEVEGSGRITYQGVTIKKFYVEELDLMGGRYSVVSKNLPEGAVSAVEVFENHQPLKILKDRVSSSQASINLKLKRKISVTGTSEIGTGVAPFLWHANITPMLFTKTFQALVSYQSNNVGKDVALQLEVLTLEEIRSNREMPRNNPLMLNIQSVSPPDIKKQRYLDNNIHLGNINVLQKLNNNYELRTNIYRNLLERNEV
jgi:hypothetical protein